MSNPFAQPLRRRFPIGGVGRVHRGSLAWLLALQAVTLFVAMPLGAFHLAGFALADVCRLVYAGVCIRVFTRNRWLRALLVAVLLLSIALPTFAARLVGGWNLIGQHELITWTVALFNITVTVVVARYVFGPGRVGADRVLGAILIYLNVTALFANLYGMVVLAMPDAIRGLSSLNSVMAPDRRADELVYFSINTMTGTGYGDLIPLHPLARSLSNLQSVIGQLFPATMIARLVGLHLAHGRRPDRRGAGPDSQ